MFLLFLYLFIALFISFTCSVLEAVLLSTTISFLNVKEAAGKKSATLFKKIKKNIDRPLSAILSFNTIAHTIGAAGVGAEATRIFGEAYFGVVSAVLTILILVFSEIIPKTIGALYWKRIALFSGKVIRIMVLVMYPLVLFSELITKLFTPKEKEKMVSREEVSELVNLGVSEGVFKENENRIIQNLIKLRTIKIDVIITPRVVVTMAPESMTIDDFTREKEFLYFSRIPIYSDNDKDNIIGYVLRQDIFNKMTNLSDQETQEVTLKDLVRPIVELKGDQTVLQVWELMLKKKENIAFIVDEFGGVDGIITMEDVIETLLGLEIVDENDKVEDMQQFAREKWERKKIKYNIRK